MKTKWLPLNLLVLFCIVAGSQSVAGTSALRAPFGRILYFLDSPENKLAVVSASSDATLYPGMLLTATRLSKAQFGGDIVTGQLRVRQVGSSQILAEVVADATEMSRKSLAEYPHLMAEDWIRVRNVNVANRKELAPVMAYSYFEIFEDPSSDPSTFEISTEGRRRLEEVVRYFSSKRFGKLVVKAFTDHNGDSAENQIESQQRAQTLKQHLIEQFDFDPQRIVALGFGESGPADESLASGYIENNRRVVFKALRTH